MPPHSVASYAEDGGTATVATVGFKLWTVLSAPVNALIVAATLSSAGQGAYYTLGSLGRWSTFLELGFGAAFQQQVGAAYARSRLPGETGADGRRRLGGLMRLGVAWHLGMAAIWLALAPAIGGAWLHTALPGTVPAWIALCAAIALGFFTLPFQYVLEGAGRVRELYAFRAGQGVRSRLVAWVLLAMGHGSAALVAERAIATVDAGRWLYGRGDFLRDAFADAEPIDWRAQFWPLQWRIAATTLGGFVPFALLVPLALALASAAEAGRLGLALSLAGASHSLAHAFLTPRIPALTAAYAIGDAVAAEGVFARATRNAYLAHLGQTLVIGAALLVDPVAWLQRGTLVSADVYGLLAAGFLVRMTREILAIRARARLVDPFWVIDLGEGVAAVPILLVGGHLDGIRGLALAFLALNVGSALVARAVVAPRR